MTQGRSIMTARPRRSTTHQDHHTRYRTVREGKKVRKQLKETHTPQCEREHNGGSTTSNRRQCVRKDSDETRGRSLRRGVRGLQVITGTTTSTKTVVRR